MSVPLVLLVDDDPDFLAIGRVFLESGGYRVSIATSAQQGLRQALAEPPAVAVVDLMMEEMDAGIWLAQQMALQPVLAQVPVVILTGVRDETGFDFVLTSAEERQWLGVREWVEKPVTRERLLAVVTAVLGKEGPDGTRAGG